MRAIAFCLVAAGLLLSCTPAAPDGAASGVEMINVVEPWPFPFSSAVRVGNMLYLSGQIGTRLVDGAPQLVPGGIDAEARQTMDNIRQVLEHSGSSLDRVVKCMVMLVDMSEWPRLNEIYATYFPGPKPARSAWGASALALGARVEITCFATVG
ncbi:MAG TPA: RidA family protein [Gemmatimonadaceae bacterium]|nr:RidA family protein [Gemmatimonadaceae bacterium]